MRPVQRRTDKQSLVSSQAGLIVGVVAGYVFLRDTRHLAHFWLIAPALVLAFEALLLFRIERN